MRVEGLVDLETCCLPYMLLLMSFLLGDTSGFQGVFSSSPAISAFALFFLPAIFSSPCQHSASFLLFPGSHLSSASLFPGKPPSCSPLGPAVCRDTWVHTGLREGTSGFVLVESTKDLLVMGGGVTVPKLT